MKPRKTPSKSKNPPAAVPHQCAIHRAGGERRPCAAGDRDDGTLNCLTADQIREVRDHAAVILALAEKGYEAAVDCSGDVGGMPLSAAFAAIRLAALEISERNCRDLEEAIFHERQSEPTWPKAVNG
jgi:hypothetical protein